MEVIERGWHAFADVVGSFLDEAAFRLVLAYDVIAGKMPREVERRRWNRSTETPVLIDVYDWTEERLIFSVLAWPPLEADEHNALYEYIQRVNGVKRAIAKGASEMMWSTRFETNYLTWEPGREVWVDTDGHTYDGSRFDKLRNSDAA